MSRTVTTAIPAASIRVMTLGQRFGIDVQDAPAYSLEDVLPDTRLLAVNEPVRTKVIPAFGSFTKFSAMVTLANTALADERERFRNN